MRVTEIHVTYHLTIPRGKREDAERAQALLDLARLRRVPLGALMTDLGSTSDA